jgi:choline dehydrogenase
VEHFDLLVVGAGSAGSVLAARLSEEGSRRVGLLEWGATPERLDQLPEEVRQARVMGGTHPAFAANYQVPVALTASVDTVVPRGRIAGGSSALNGAYFCRGIWQNFDHWAELGNDLWSYDEVLPYFRRLESDCDYPADPFHGDTGPVPVSRGLDDERHPVSAAFEAACVEVGYREEPDKNAPGELGYGPLPLNRRGDLRANMAICYLMPALGRPNLTVIGDAFVSRVLIEGGRAIGVDATIAGERREIRADEVVISAGSVKSPHLLMLSGIGPEAQLRAQGIEVVADLPVGAALRDHPCLAAAFVPHSIDPLPPGAGLFQSALSFTSEDSDWPGDIEIYPLVLPIGEMMPAPDGAGLYGDGGELLSVVTLLQQPESAGTMTLRSTDPEELPRIEYGYLVGESDRRRCRQAIRATVELLEAPAFAPIVAERLGPDAATLRSDGALDDWIAANISTGIHMTSSCPLGPADSEIAVVDQHCVVHGVEGLRVVDASVMPNITSHGPSATTTMIGERVAALFH